MNPLTSTSPDITPALNQILGTIVKWYPVVLADIKSFVFILVGISIPLSVFFLIVIIYCVEQLKKIRKAEVEKYDLKVEPAYEATAPAGNVVMAQKWDSVKKHIESDKENDWRQAIMDADIILDDLLTKMGYQGESIGEKLKRVATGDFASLDDAWEAHKLRNRIAHEGTTFSLGHHEAKAAIDQYKRVFEEFYYI